MAAAGPHQPGALSLHRPGQEEPRGRLRHPPWPDRRRHGATRRGRGQMSPSWSPSWPQPVLRPCHRFTATSPRLPSHRVARPPSRRKSTMTTEPGLDGPLSALVGTDGSSPRLRCRRTDGPSTTRVVGRVTPSTATAGPTTRSSAQHARRELHRFVRGRSTSRTAIITWESQQTDYPSTARTSRSTGPRLPRGAAFSWYTYSPPGSATPMCVGSSSRCTALPRPSTPTRSMPGRASSPTRRRAPTRRARQAAWSGRRGPRSTNSSPPHTSTIGRWGPDRIAGFSPSPRCPRSPMPPAPASTNSSAPPDALLLRLVCRPAQRLAADVR